MDTYSQDKLLAKVIKLPWAIEAKSLHAVTHYNIEVLSFLIKVIGPWLAVPHCLARFNTCTQHVSGKNSFSLIWFFFTFDSVLLSLNACHYKAFKSISEESFHGNETSTVTHLYHFIFELFIMIFTNGPNYCELSTFFIICIEVFNDYFHYNSYYVGVCMYGTIRLRNMNYQ